MIGKIRESFARKLFAGLLGTAGVLLAVTYGVVRSVTAQQVEAEAERVSRSASALFGALEDNRRQQVARVADLLTEGPRFLAAVEDGDVDYVAGEVEYQLGILGLEELLVFLTDTGGRPIVSLRLGGAVGAEDPVGLTEVALRILGGEADEIRSYRVLDGVLYSVRSQIVYQGAIPIGTLSLGLPVPDAEVARGGEFAGVEVCFVVGGVCVAATPLARESLAATLAASEGRREPLEATALGMAWSIQAQPLIDADPGQGWRVTAVPLDQVLAPFRRIAQALVLAGALALALSVLVGVALSRGLTRPVRALVEATGRVARGDYQAEVPVTTRDELGTLAAAFNDMTHGLLLKDRMQSVLNKVVSRDVAEELMRGSVELGGENRRVTMLFADIRGFSSLTEGMEPQRVIALLNECMQLLSDAVDAEGGVVDKYVGDELMAVFGAPVAQEDDAVRALRAAVAMREAVSDLNTRRQARGEPAIGLGVGVNTGVVVAGNMGSKERLNYTVLGDAVNLAARLCSGAEAGEILATRASVEAAGRGVEARSRGGRRFKGFTGDVEVLSVERVAERAPVAHASIAPLLVLALVVGAAGVGAQELPTLRDLGAEYMSRDGRLQIALSGQLDVEALRVADPGYGLVVGDGFFVAPRLRLFTDLFAGDHVYGLVELRGDRGDAHIQGEWDARVEQAFLRVGTASGSFAVQAGRFASPFGSYALRHFTPQDPFLRPPLVYDDRTVMCAAIAPGSLEGFLTWRDRPGEFRGIGAPPIWGVPYQWGVMASGSKGSLSWRAAAMNSAPSSEPEAWGWSAERMRHPSLVAAVGLRLTPALSVGASWNRGAWMEELKSGAYPAGTDQWDYMQTLTAMDVTWAEGGVVVRAEVMRDEWEVPNTGYAPVELGGSVEAQVDVVAGVFVAGRAGFLDFRPVRQGGNGHEGPSQEWDYDVRRYEASVGYRLDRNAGVLASWSHQPRRSELEGARSLLAARFWLAF